MGSIKLNKMDQAKDLQKHTKLPCEKEENCLICIPLKLGMQIFGVFAVLGGVLNALNAVLIFTVNVVFGLIFIVFSLVSLYNAWIWFQWFKKNDQEATGKVVWFTKILYIVGVILNIVFGVLFIVMGVYPNVVYAIVSVIINILLTIVVGWYFFQVTVRYHVQEYGETGYAKVL